MKFMPWKSEGPTCSNSPQSSGNEPIWSLATQWRCLGRPPRRKVQWFQATETTPDSSSLLGPKDLSARHLVRDNEIPKIRIGYHSWLMTYMRTWRELVSIRPSEAWWQPGSLCFARPDLAIVAFKDFVFLLALFCLSHKPKKRKNITNHLCQSICISETDPFALDAQQCQIYCDI